MSDEPVAKLVILAILAILAIFALLAILAILAMETIGLRIPERATKGEEVFFKLLFRR